MYIPGFWAAVLILIGLWAIAGVIRDYRGTKQAALDAYHATHHALTPAEENGDVRARAVLAEMTVGGAAVAAGFGAALGYAAGQDAYHAVKRRRAARRAQTQPDTQDTPDANSGAGGTAQSAAPETPETPVGPGGDAQAAPGQTETDLGPQDGDGDTPNHEAYEETRWDRLFGFFGYTHPRGHRHGQRPRASEYADAELLDDDPSEPFAQRVEPEDVIDVEPVEAAELGPASPTDSTDGIDDAEIIHDPSAHPVPPHLKEIPRMTEMSIDQRSAASLSPSATLNRAKADLQNTRDAAGALSTALGTQTLVAAAAAQSARKRATNARALAEQLARAATKARNDVAFGQGNRLDPSSLAAFGALAQEMDTVANEAAAYAERAERAASEEENEAVACNKISIAVARIAPLAENVRATLSRHQDAHQYALHSTGNEAAATEFLAG